MIHIQTIARDTPLNELTLRRYEKPESLQDRALVRKLCLSLGVLQPGDSRDIIVDILDVMLKNRTRREEMASDEIQKLVVANRKQYNLPMIGIAPSNIRRQLKRLRDIMLVEKTVNSYRMTEFSNLKEIFNEKLEKYLLSSIMSRVREYIQKVDDNYDK